MTVAVDTGFLVGVDASGGVGAWVGAGAAWRWPSPVVTSRSTVIC
jgi:hypothetical protein